MGAPNTPSNSPTIAHAAWVAEAVEMANEGMSERQIAKRLGLHHSTVQEALTKEFERIRPSPEQIEAWRERKRERLYRGLEKWTKRRDDSLVLAETVLDKLPDHRAGELVLKTEALIAALEGTDAPKRTEVEHSGAVGEVSPAAAARLIREEFGDHAAKREVNVSAEREASVDSVGDSAVPAEAPEE